MMNQMCRGGMMCCRVKKKNGLPAKKRKIAYFLQISEP